MVVPEELFSAGGRVASREGPLTVPPADSPQGIFDFGPYRTSIARLIYLCLSDLLSRPMRVTRGSC